VTAVLLAAGEPASDLERRLVGLAEAWARDVAGEGFDVAPVGEGLVAAAERVLSSGDGPLLLIWPVLTRWRPEHASAALADLASGTDLVLGPTMDAGLYLLGLHRPLPGLLERFEAPLDDDAVVLGAQAAEAAGIEIGLLRVERGLSTQSDARAALIDPLTPPEIRALLGQER
jgi:hypothetical protein